MNDIVYLDHYLKTQNYEEDGLFLEAIFDAYVSSMNIINAGNPLGDSHKRECD